MRLFDDLDHHLLAEVSRRVLRFLDHCEIRDPRVCRDGRVENRRAGDQMHLGLKVGLESSAVREVLCRTLEEVLRPRFDLEQTECLVGRLDERVDQIGQRSGHHQPEQEDLPPVTGEPPDDRASTDPGRGVPGRLRSRIGLWGCVTGRWALRARLGPFRVIHRRCLSRVRVCPRRVRSGRAGPPARPLEQTPIVGAGSVRRSSSKRQSLQDPPAAPAQARRCSFCTSVASVRTSSFQPFDGSSAGANRSPNQSRASW